MSDLTTEEKVYLVECFSSTGKEYIVMLIGDFVLSMEHRVTSENTLKSLERIIHIFTCIASASGKALLNIFLVT